MAIPKREEGRDKNVLNAVVMWFCCGFFFILCGYGLYRQHCLEQRVIVLEAALKELKRTVPQEPVTVKDADVLRRETRDVDCNCPPGK